MYDDIFFFERGRLCVVIGIWLNPKLDRVFAQQIWEDFIITNGET